MKILTLNAGSSSLKFGVFDMSTNDGQIFKGEYENFQVGQCTLHTYNSKTDEKITRDESLTSLKEAIQHLPRLLQQHNIHDFEAIGHRIVHGGDKFHKATIITDTVFQQIQSCIPLAPLHNPANIAVVQMAQSLWPGIPHVAIFDTAFHHTIPESAYTYAVPKLWRDTGLRRYGFHGTSHKYIGMRTAESLHRSATELRIISCHLGNGASVCAINRGFSVDTSMGITTLEGLVMGTRSGDVDPGLFGFLHRELGLSIEDIESQLYHKSGIKGLTGSSDFRDVEARATQGDTTAQLALNIYSYHVRKYIGAYTAVMGGIDALVFTGGVGENSSLIRRLICDHLGFLGLYIDDVKNQASKLQDYEAERIQSEDSHIAVIVTKTFEQWMIAKEVQQLLVKKEKQTLWHIPVAVSARHIHLTQEHVEALFGKGYQLTKMKDLSQPENWAAEETLEIVGPKGRIPHVRILGPTRSHTQIEVSKTDTFVLGVQAPVRASGELENTRSIKLRNKTREIETDGLIIAARHIHMHPDDALKIGLQDGEHVDVRLGDGERDILFTHTLIRVNDNYVTEMHIDTDEANASGISIRTDGELILKEGYKSGNIIASH